MDRGVVERVVVSIESAQSRQQIERFVFEVDVDLHEGGTGAADRAVRPSNQEELEDALRCVIFCQACSPSALLLSSSANVRRPGRGAML